MKYALLFFLLSFSAMASPIESFSDSPSLMTVAQFMEDSGSDMKVSARLSDKKLKLPDTSSCVVVAKKDIMKAADSAIHAVLRFYPDEELPIDDALVDLEAYIGSSTFKKCEVFQSNKRKIISTQYFFDSKDQKHIKVDTITLLAE